MSFIPAVPADPPPADVAPIDALRGVIAHFPDGLGAFDQMYARMVGQGRLDLTMRLAVLGAAARWRSDDHTAGFMFDQAIVAGLDASVLGTWIDEAERREPGSAEAALLTYCRKATESAFKMIQRDVDELLVQEWTNGQIVEAVTMVGLSGYITVMSAAGGLLAGPTLEAEPWR